MKNIFTFILLFMLNVCFAMTEANAQQQAQTIETAEGFPYKNLIMKADKVELIYTDNSDSITCRVNVFNKELTYRGKAKTISINKFKKVPMAACLTRPVAKLLLKKL
jgi:hypothetical protein